MWFIQICKILKMCKNAKTTLFSLTQPYPFLFTPWFIFFLLGSFPFMFNMKKIDPCCLLFEKSPILLQQWGHYSTSIKDSRSFFYGVIILLYTSAERKGSENVYVFSVYFFPRLLPLSYDANVN